ncbi:hypothetical protein ALT1545_620001 [Alteromonas macleodii]
MYSVVDTCKQVGFPIRTSVAQMHFVSSPQLFADLHVLHRL